MPKARRSSARTRTAARSSNEHGDESSLSNGRTNCARCHQGGFDATGHDGRPGSAKRPSFASHPRPITHSLVGISAAQEIRLPRSPPRHSEHRSRAGMVGSLQQPSGRTPIPTADPCACPRPTASARIRWRFTRWHTRRNPHAIRGQCRCPQTFTRMYATSIRDATIGSYRLPRQHNVRERSRSCTWETTR